MAEASVVDKANKLADHVQKHHDAAKSVAEVINDKLPEHKKLEVPQLDKKASVKENTSKLVNFIQAMDDFVEELEPMLREDQIP